MGVGAHVYQIVCSTTQVRAAKAPSFPLVGSAGCASPPEALGRLGYPTTESCVQVKAATETVLYSPMIPLFPKMGSDTRFCVFIQISAVSSPISSEIAALGSCRKLPAVHHQRTAVPEVVPRGGHVFAGGAPALQLELHERRQGEPRLTQRPSVTC